MAVPEFKDATGRTWRVVLGPREVGDLKAVGFDLTTVARDSEYLARSFGDVAGMIGLLWHLCRRQARACKIGRGRFRRLVTGRQEVFEQAAEAAFSALVAGAGAYVPGWVVPAGRA